MPQKILINNESSLVVGVGSALVDILLRESDEFLAATGAVKGGMTFVEPEEMEMILSRSSQSPSMVPGGSACNTIIGIGKLGGHARFIGKRGGDKLGIMLDDSLKNQSVEPVLEISDLIPTGRVLSIITPDAQRTMLTFLGAASKTSPGEMTPEKFQGAAIVHIEGYLLFNEELIFAALEAAKEAGALISLDLASFTVVEASKDIITNIVRNYVDILLANEDEAKAYTGIKDEEKSLLKLADDAEIAVLKVGKRGSYVARNGNICRIGIKGDGSAIDTTGAGDLWASGFLYGLVNNMPIEKCGEIAAACGHDVCQMIGAHIPEQGWDRIKTLI